MKKLSLFVILIIMVALAGCLPENADDQQARQTKAAMKEANAQVGMPNIVNYQQKKLMKAIQELCDKEDLICYAYIKSDYTGKLNYLGKCMGYGIPFSAQYTNPERYASQGLALPQPDPNGLFMPTSSSATWLMMIDPNTNKPRPVYVESELTVSPFKLQM